MYNEALNQLRRSLNRMGSQHILLNIKLTFNKGDSKTMNAYNRSFYMIITICFLTLLRISNVYTQSTQVIPLWDKSVSEDRDANQKEIIANERIKNVHQPTIEVISPNKEEISGAAVLICPGGAYDHVTINKEGYQVAKWLNTCGITGIVLKYRLNPETALKDARRAMCLIRSHAKDWNIDTNKVGIMGFSAGAHLAINLSTHYKIENGEATDEIDLISARPDFAILLYCGTRGIDVNSAVDSTTPPTFLIHASDDRTTLPANSIDYYLALFEAKVPAELHIYEKGGHGFGIGKKHGPISTWPDRCIEWLKIHGIVDY